jgi:hypothetical protein
LLVAEAGDQLVAVVVLEGLEQAQILEFQMELLIQ